ncbi:MULTISPECIES: MarR family winged helix-turn-helix transcriptional regulator [unclassified Herbaspirillum]|jgi:DNA-binding MarR family transcriptional regulator|uniref:MarR family winged helix-turn-helix transcriptional regulator n=1 Tax=unclassified Herbaspirillum TaxID=2624150 RepID=UPI000E2F8BDA|nr:MULTISPECIES: MarR family winged helix-turn-helix transcriptional regulator [unclassified Herbaspirillum]RFB69727.1 MarR family transcriptional regulator [Herbaspirillum sp. 3R-3a1]TFI07210.1 MarR family transcriptional regulator [Herbaspirillum sp. 3R11]TFI13148.1 MarR family transcriptional regulator [Herbaspirillum sp. 3R-11]TFI24206.1 MarR family transcriptional regulator [Herbaspirillum sp. 3C11]
MDTIPSIADCNLFATKQAARFVTQLYERHLAVVNVTSSQVTILAVLHQRPDITMTELSEMVVMDRTSLVRAIQPLSRDGYILQKSEPGSRKISLSLSKAGARKYLDAVPCWRAAQEEYEELVGKDRAKLLRQELMAITQR